MKFKRETVKNLLSDLDQLIDQLDTFADLHGDAWQAVSTQHQKSSLNLVHYEGFRKTDLRVIQKKLRNLGLSRLANAEGHIMASILKIKFILLRLLGGDTSHLRKPVLSMKKGRRLLTRNTKELLGYRAKGRRVRIMVTQPTESAYNYALVLQMVKSGMNCARINCAHDSPEVWKKMILNLRKAAQATGKRVKIAMDLAGPKIRTGSIKPGPRIRKFTPQKDVTGSIINPAEILFVPKMDEFSTPNSLLLDAHDWAALQVDDTFELIDTRNKKRRIKVISRNDREVLAFCYETSYIGTGTQLHCRNRNRPDVVIGELPPVEQAIVLHTHDRLLIMREDREGSPAIIDEDGNVLKVAEISCQLPEIFKYVSLNDRIIFDDGKIEGKIVKITKKHLEVTITLAKENGSKLRAQKGMNFPDTKLEVPGLTDKDKTDLAFVATHADIVNFSFVHSASDVSELYAELSKHQVLDKIGVILKIETRSAFDNLMEILLRAMGAKNIGVMIARGDLAVETGWDHIAKVQDEMLKLCAAAHVPVVWATQVLENLSKKGLPSRAEITDAASSVRAECVMLNKGSHINRAISLLSKMLSDLENFQEKKESMLPKKEKLW